MTPLLFKALIGACSIAWCSFHPVWYEGEAYLLVREWEKSSDTIEEVMYPIVDLDSCNILIDTFKEVVHKYEEVVE